MYVAVLGIMKDASHFEVSVDNAGEDMVMSSEDLAYQKLREMKIKPEPQANQGSQIRVINISGQAGAGATVKFALEEATYAVESLTVDETRSEQKTIVVYPQGQEEEALALRNILKVGLLSAQTDSNEKSIIIYAGKDSLSQ
jgi:hypothetical protein